VSILGEANVQCSMFNGLLRGTQASLPATHLEDAQFILTLLCYRRFGIPAEHHCASGMPNTIVRQECRTPLSVRNAEHHCAAGMPHLLFVKSKPNSGEINLQIK